MHNEKAPFIIYGVTLKEKSIAIILSDSSLVRHISCFIDICEYPVQNRALDRTFYLRSLIEGLSDIYSLLSWFSLPNYFYASYALMSTALLIQIRHMMHKN